MYVPMWKEVETSLERGTMHNFFNAMIHKNHNISLCLTQGNHLSTCPLDSFYLALCFQLFTTSLLICFFRAPCSPGLPQERSMVKKPCPCPCACEIFIYYCIVLSFEFRACVRPHLNVIMTNPISSFILSNPLNPVNFFLF